MMASQQQRFVKVTDVNPHLLCVLCGGYYVDATTIIECLHSFCKSCIVRYLETNKYCPICDVQVHKSRPLLNIRPDRTLQSIVNKLVPGLFQRELNCRKEFYKEHLKKVANDGSSSADIAEDCPIYLPDEPMLLGIQYINPSDGKVAIPASAQGCHKRWLRCPAAITVRHLHKLMRAKFNLNPSQAVEFLHAGESLPEFMSLMDLAYMYNWKRKQPVELGYRLLECQQKRIKLSQEEPAPSPVIAAQTTARPVEDRVTQVSEPLLRPEDQPDREVQLQISENGVMSVQSVDSCSGSVTSDPAVIESKPLETTVVSVESKAPVVESKAPVVESKSPVVDSKPPTVSRKPGSKRSSPFKDLQPESKKLAKCVERLQVPSSLPTTSSESSAITNAVTVHSVPSSTSVTLTTVQTTVTAKSQEPSQEKSSRLLSPRPEEARKEAKSAENKIKSYMNNNSIRPNHVSMMGYQAINVPNTSVTVQKVYPGAVREHSHPKLKPKEPMRAEVKEPETSLSIVRTSEKSEPKPVNNVKYPTLKSVKPWNPSIPRSTIMAMKQAQRADEEKAEPGKTSKAPKFFKMRNMPRFLGNPASGVKPMYQVLSSPERSPQTSSAQNNKPNSEMTVMKIDPKTLNPIPVVRMAKPKQSPPPGLNRLPIFNSQPKSESPSVSGRTQIRNPVSKNAGFKTNPNQVHGVSLPTSTSLQTNPFLLPPHPSQHMLYGGFPRAYPPVTASERMPSESQILRAMSMFCRPNTGYHPSLPPPISMLFNPHHPHHRASSDRLKHGGEFSKSPGTPSVQRVPPSGPGTKLGLALTAHTAADAGKPTQSSMDMSNGKTNSARHELPAGPNKRPGEKSAARKEEDRSSREVRSVRSGPVRDVKADGSTPVSSAQGVKSAPESAQSKSRDSVSSQNKSRDSVSSQNKSRDSVSCQNKSRDSVSCQNKSRDSVSSQNNSRDSVSSQNKSRDSVPLSNGFPEPPASTAITVDPSKPSPGVSAPSKSPARSLKDASDQSSGDQDKNKP